jgi:hypothetical protein
MMAPINGEPHLSLFSIHSLPFFEKSCETLIENQPWRRQRQGNGKDKAQGKGEGKGKEKAQGKGRARLASHPK